MVQNSNCYMLRQKVQTYEVALGLKNILRKKIQNSEVALGLKNISNSDNILPNRSINVTKNNDEGWEDSASKSSHCIILSKICQICKNCCDDNIIIHRANSKGVMN